MYLEGEDARRFHKYLENPSELSESAKQLFRDALAYYIKNRCPVCGGYYMDPYTIFDPPV